MATDQEIRDKGIKFLPQQKYLQSPYQFNEPVVEEIEESEAPSFGIPNTNAFTNSGENNFNNFSNNPYTANLNQGDFVTNRTSYGTTGYLPGTEPQPSRFEPAINLFKRGLGMAIPGGNFLMGMAENNSRENRLNAIDNAFIDMQLANQEQNLKGVGNIANQDAYGYGKVGFGNNYAAKVRERADIARAKAKENINNPNYKVRPIDAYYLEKEKEFEDTKKKVEFNDFVRQRTLANKIRGQIKAGTAINPGAALHSGLGLGRVTSSVIQGESGGKTRGTSRASDHGGVGLGHNAGNVRSANEAGTGSAQGYNQNLKSGGRAGYFFGGRVKYKAGGRTGYKDGYSVQDDIGDYAENVGKEAAPGGGFVGDGDNNPPSRFNPYVERIFDNYKEPVDFGLRDFRINKNIGNNTRLTSVLNTQKTLDDEKLAAEIELNNRLGGLETNLTYNTNKKPESNINFSKVSPFGTFTANANNIYGSNLSYNNNIKGVDVNAITNFDNLNNLSLSKFSGDPNETGFSYGIGTNIDPLDLSNSNIFAGAKFKFGKGNKDGGRIGFKNGGLASIL